ncbi:MAG: aminotransferase class V-fold PLP-dependent enzyme [Candidatus Omnitrophica bacterium]|nr:aminotransferase class V-fold PLP-dependent enzyme [Candidatus Omnitrophota bacterium]
MIYLDNSATSFPKPEAVHQAMGHFARHEAGSPNRAGHFFSRAADTHLRGAREALCELFNAPDPNRMISTFNATDALNMAIKGVLRRGDHVVTTVIEHNSVLRPLRVLEDRGMIQVTRLEPKPGASVVSALQITGAMRENTRLVAVVHGSNVTGVLQPVADMGPAVRSLGAYFLVDASQTVGHVPIDVQTMEIDLLAFPGHKGLLGPAGTGALWVDPRVEIQTWREGGTGFDSQNPVQPAEFPAWLEAGSPNTLGMAGLKAGVEYVLDRGVQEIARWESNLRERLVSGLEGIPGLRLIEPRPKSGAVCVVSFLIEGVTPSGVGAWMDEARGIACRTGLLCAPLYQQWLGTFPEGVVRFSPGCMSTEEEIDEAISAVEACAGHFARVAA